MATYSYECSYSLKERAPRVCVYLRVESVTSYPHGTPIVVVCPVYVPMYINPSLNNQHHPLPQPTIFSTAARYLCLIDSRSRSRSPSIAQQSMPPSRIALLGVIYLAWCLLGAFAFSISFQRNPRFGTPPGSTASAYSPSPSALSNIIPLIDAKPTFASTTSLYGGTGTAETYSWKEEQFEIEIKLAVPPGTSAKDIKFKCASQSIDLRLINATVAGAGGEIVLLDGARKTRGAICVDGTFWSIETLPRSRERQVTVTVEKHFVPESTLPDLLLLPVPPTPAPPPATDGVVRGRWL